MTIASYQDKTLRQYEAEYEEEIESSAAADAITAAAGKVDSLETPTGESPGAEAIAHSAMLGKRSASENKAADDERVAEGKKRQATRSPVKTPISAKETSSLASTKATSKQVGDKSFAKADVDMEIEDTTVEAVFSSPKDGKKKKANSNDVASGKVVRVERASEPAHKPNATARGGQGGFVDPLQAGAVVGEEVILSRARSGGRSSSSTATGAATVSKRYRYGCPRKTLDSVHPRKVQRVPIAFATCNVLRIAGVGRSTIILSISQNPALVLCVQVQARGNARHGQSRRGVEV